VRVLILDYTYYNLQRCKSLHLGGYTKHLNEHYLEGFVPANAVTSGHERCTGQKDFLLPVRGRLHSR
jgi:hypothetical protein